MSGETGTQVRAEPLKDFCVRVFRKMGVPEEDARITTDVLVAANMRGIDSHGVARLRRYVNGLRDGMMVARPQVQVVTETPTTALIDAGPGWASRSPTGRWSRRSRRRETWGAAS